MIVDTVGKLYFPGLCYGPGRDRRAAVELPLGGHRFLTSFVRKTCCITCEGNKLSLEQIVRCGGIKARGSFSGVSSPTRADLVTVTISTTSTA